MIRWGLYGGIDGWTRGGVRIWIVGGRGRLELGWHAAGLCPRAATATTTPNPNPNPNPNPDTTSADSNGQLPIRRQQRHRFFHAEARSARPGVVRGRGGLHLLSRAAWRPEYYAFRILRLDLS